MAAKNNNASDLVNVSTNWICANLASDICLREALLEVLHNSNNGLPKDPKALYNRMVVFKRDHERKLKNVIRQNQWNVICPPSGESNSEDWDITIIKVVIQYENILQPPIGGWEQNSPGSQDTSQASYVWRAKDIRNDLKHATIEGISDTTTFNDLMIRIENVLNGLGYNKMGIFQDLKTCHLETYTGDSVKLLKDTISDIQQDIKNLKQNEDTANYKTKLNQLEDVIYDFRSQIKDAAVKDDIRDMLKELSSQHDQIKRNEERLKRLQEGQDDLRESQKKIKSELDDLKNSKTITENDLKKAMRKHREKVLDTYSCHKVNHPIIVGSSNSCLKQREEVYVHLTLTRLKINTNQREMQSIECHEYLEQDSLPSQDISIDEIVKRNIRYVLIEGIAGIGKTQLMEIIVLKWANGKILNGEKGVPNIDLLLPIKCRELNELVSASDTDQSILKKLFPELFDEISITDLEKMDYTVMFIIDGLDELMSIDQINQLNNCPNNPHRYKVLQFVRDIIINEKSIFKKHYKVVSGRPATINSIIHSIDTRTVFENIQVLGFSKENVKEYIRKHCDSLLQKKVTKEIESSEYLTTMSRIPVYLWVICNIYKDDLQVPAPRTTTELMIYACLVFIRNHLLHSDCDVRNLPLQEILLREDVLKLILSIAKISFVSLSEGKVIFNSEEMENLQCDVNGLEKKLGFIVKTGNGEVGYLYQFTHLVLHEFFAAIHIFLSNEFTPVIADKRSSNTTRNYITYTREKVFDLKSSSILPFIRISDMDDDQFGKICLKNIDVCFSIIAGLEGIEFLKSPNWRIIKSFVEQLKQFSEKNDRGLSLMTLYNSLQQNLLNLSGNGQIDPSNPEKFYNFDIYLQCCFENGCDLPPELVNKILRKGIKFEFQGRDHFKRKIILHFLQKLALHSKYLEQSLSKIILKLTEILSCCTKCDMSLTVTIYIFHSSWTTNFELIYFDRKPEELA